MTKAQYFGGGENAPPRTPRELKEAQMRANSQIICAVQPNSDGHSLTVEIQKGALGAGKVLAAGGLEIQPSYSGQNKSEAFKDGEFTAAGKLSDPKTGAYAGQVELAGNKSGADYSCLFKGAAEGSVPKSGQMLNQPVAAQVTPSAIPGAKP